MILTSSLVSRAALTAIGLSALSLPAAADAAFASFGGSWRGSGNIVLSGGQSERLTCKAYYTPKSGGVQLGIAISCASAGNKIDLRANLDSSGSKVSGSWEERSFNSSGSISGSANGGKMTLGISGTLKGTMSISTGGSSQSVSIKTDGTGFKSVNLKLSKT